LFTSDLNVFSIDDHAVYMITGDQQDEVLTYRDKFIRDSAIAPFFTTLRWHGHSVEINDPRPELCEGGGVNPQMEGSEGCK